jgi:hypothetical protein
MFNQRVDDVHRDNMYDLENNRSISSIESDGSILSIQNTDNENDDRNGNDCNFVRNRRLEFKFSECLKDERDTDDEEYPISLYF